MDISNLSIATIRSLGIDTINKANSGHPGMVLGSAPALYTLFNKELNIYNKEENWINRDRFVLASGHASALLYSLLHLDGFDVTIDDLKNWIAKTIDYAAKNFRENELNRHEQLVNSIKSYINANYDSISNIEQITSSIYISESYARRIFKSLTGKTIFEYLQIVRMEKAKQLLENPKYRIYEIADMVGYKSKPYFVETFRKYTGVSPKDYRSRK